MTELAIVLCGIPCPSTAFSCQPEIGDSKGDICIPGGILCYTPTRRETQSQDPWLHLEAP